MFAIAKLFLISGVLRPNFVIVNLGFLGSPPVESKYLTNNL